MITTVNPHKSLEGYVNFSASVNHRFLVSTKATTMQKALLFIQQFQLYICFCYTMMT